MIVTVITHYEGSSGATYVGAVTGKMDADQRAAFRKHFSCAETAFPTEDEDDEDYDDDDENYLFFREVTLLPEGAMPDASTALLEQCDEAS